MSRPCVGHLGSSVCLPADRVILIYTIGKITPVAWLSIYCCFLYTVFFYILNCASPWNISHSFSRGVPFYSFHRNGARGSCRDNAACVEKHRFGGKHNVRGGRCSAIRVLRVLGLAGRPTTFRAHRERPYRTHGVQPTQELHKHNRNSYDGGRLVATNMSATRIHTGR